MKYIIIFIITCCSICSLGQDKSDLKNIAQIDSLIHANIDLDNMDYVCYSVNDKVVIASKSKCIYYLSLKEGLLHKELVAELSVDTLFNKSNVRAGKVFSNGDYGASCIGSYVYLSLNRGGKKVFQFNLPYIILCGKKKVTYPFDYQALEQLNKLLFSFFTPRYR